MTTNNITWSNQQGHRDRRGWLLLVKGDEVLPFSGEDIAGVAIVRGTIYHKNGKWSNTTFRIDLGSNVREIVGLDGWETGTFVEGLRSAVKFNRPIDTWTDVAQALGVSVPSAMAFLRAWRPKAAEALDEVDIKLTALDEAADAAEAKADTETVMVSFGSPTRRQRAEGFWTSPKDVPNHAGATIELIDPTKGWEGDNIRVVGVVGTVLNVTYAPGHGGGYVSVTAAIVPGTTTPPVPETGGRTFFRDVPADELKAQLAAPLPESTPPGPAPRFGLNLGALVAKALDKK